jgi:L-2-hydroxyglutarate oxidase
LDRAGLAAIEPCAAGVSAALVPQEGIVDYRAVCDAMAGLIRGQEGEIRTGAKVVQLEHRPEGWIATTSAGKVESRFLVNCAGLHSDRMAALAGERPDVQIVPFRGEYYELTDEAKGMVRNLIYPVPDPAFPFLGTHFTRLIQGGVECGPNAVLAFAREGYRMRTINPRDLAETLLYPGLWRFLRRYPAMAWDESAKSFFRKSFCRSLQKLVPDIRDHHLQPGGAGVRAQAMTRDGQLVQDFQLIRRPAALHVLNAPSPAATASLAIGAYIAREIDSGA